MDTPDIPPECRPEPQPAPEREADAKPAPEEKYRAEDFLPSRAPLRDQVELQVAFLTQAVMESSVYSCGQFDVHEAPPPFAKSKPEYQRASRVYEIELMTKAARATASLIGALGRATRYLEPHSSVTTTYDMDADGKKMGYVMRTFMSLPHAAKEPEPEKAKNEGSNGGG